MMLINGILHALEILYNDFSLVDMRNILYKCRVNGKDFMKHSSLQSLVADNNFQLQKKKKYETTCKNLYYDTLK